MRKGLTLTCQKHNLEVIHLKELNALPQQIKQINGFAPLVGKWARGKLRELKMPLTIKVNTRLATGACF